MFDAARAALLASGAPTEPDIGRTHSGLIGAFGNFLVKNGPVPKEVGRLLNRAHEIRLIADHNGDSVEITDAINMVEQAEIFASTMYTKFISEKLAVLGGTMPEVQDIPRNRETS